ncbi:MAG: hypothetical protein M1840_003819 [Geoglossum simile]|nr:MAG: hypothetical protein M1840_003819 [Geoglossum simile]
MSEGEIAKHMQPKARVSRVGPRAVNSLDDRETKIKTEPQQETKIKTESQQETATTKNFTSRTDRRHINSDKKTRGELKRTIKELQDEVVSLKRRISETADYVDEKFEKVLKLRKYVHVYNGEEPIAPEEKYVSRHDCIYERVGISGLYSLIGRRI